MAARRPAPPPPTMSTSQACRSMTLAHPLRCLTSPRSFHANEVCGTRFTVGDDERPDVAAGHWEWSKQGRVVRGPEPGNIDTPAGPDGYFVETSAVCAGSRDPVNTLPGARPRDRDGRTVAL